MKLIPKDWDKHQHYKDRKPQWIKLHRDLLNDFSYSLVRIGTKATLPLLWLLSCEYDDGVIDATIEEIAFRIHIDKNTVQTAIDELISIGWYTLVQNDTEPYPREEKRRDREETEKEEECTRLNLEAFKMWCNYKGAKYSKQGKTISRNKLLKFDKSTQMKMVENSIMNNYKGLFEIKTQQAFKSKEPEVGSIAWRMQQEQNEIDVEVVDVTVT